jgi:PPOX class probable F420-dependent enzyme
MATTMTDDERRAFLSVGTRTAILSVTRRDGTPHAAPVWFVLDGDEMVFTCAGESAKARMLQRARWAVLTVDEARPPYSYVSVRGPIEIATDIEAMLPWAIALGGRYMGAENAEEFGRRNAVPGELLVRLKPEHVVALRGIAD